VNIIDDRYVPIDPLLSPIKWFPGAEKWGIEIAHDG